LPHQKTDLCRQFDKINEDAVINFTFLRARIIFDLLERHPSPPPFTLLTLGVSLLRAPCGIAARWCLASKSKLVKADLVASSLNALAGASTVLAHGTSASSAKDKAGSLKHFCLVADYTDEIHVRNTSKTLANHISMLTSEVRSCKRGPTPA